MSVLIREAAIIKGTVTSTRYCWRVRQFSESFITKFNCPLLLRRNKKMAVQPNERLGRQAGSWPEENDKLISSTTSDLCRCIDLISLDDFIQS